jgi:hypothetical protein
MDDLEALIAREAWGEALDLALRFWTQQRDGVLGRAIVELGRRASGPAKWPRGKPEKHAAFLERAKQISPATLSVLVDALTASLEIHADHYGILQEDYAATKYAPLLERVSALAGWKGRDPRVAAALVELIERAPYSAYSAQGSRVIYGPMVELIERHGDAGHAQRLAALLASPKAKIEANRIYFAQALPDVIRSLERHAAPEPRTALERWLTSVAPNVASSSHGPPPAGAEAVYADVLLATGDPRGELIALQLREEQGDATAEMQKRIRALIKRHQTEWLGALAPVVKGIEWRRGYLDRCELAQNSATTPAGWDAAADSPALASVRWLLRGRGNEAHYRAFVGAPQAKAIEVIDAPTAAFMDWLVAQPVAGQLKAICLQFKVGRRTRELLSQTRVFASLDKLVLWRAETDLNGINRLVKAGPLGARVKVIQGTYPQHAALE